MSNYDFSPRVPVLYTEPDCKFDKHHRRDSYHSLDNVYADCHSGNIWCPLCGARQPAGTNVYELCTGCRAGSRPMLWLRGEVLRIRNAYVEQVASEQPYLPDSKAHSYSQRKWIEALVLRQQCKASLIRTADVLQRTFLSRQGSPVENIYEFDFVTKNWNHCAFLFVTNEGDFIFDPTGQQFGPSWPVLQGLAEYIGCITEEIDGCDPLGTLRQRYIDASPEQTQ